MIVQKGAAPAAPLCVLPTRSRVLGELLKSRTASGDVTSTSSALDKGKPVERRGRKATGPAAGLTGGGSRVAERTRFRPAGAGPKPGSSSRTPIAGSQGDPRTMLEKLRARMDQSEEGFTLIELMVVVLIIAI